MPPELLAQLHEGKIEAGVDEAGRGCLAGPVVAAAVILPPYYQHPLLNDSKQLTASNRVQLRKTIEQDSLAWAIGLATPSEIDALNILQASFLAMHRAIAALSVKPDWLLIDGNRFKSYPNLPHTCVVKGDARIRSIAAASILAKTYRDEYMTELAQQFPQYQWQQNVGYPTAQHYAAIAEHGISPHHRKSFRLYKQKTPPLFCF